GTDFENCAAAVSDKKIPVAVERQSRGHAHALDPLLSLAVLRHAMDGAVVAAGDEEVTPGADGHASGIDQRSDIGFHGIIGADFIKRDRYTLTARAAERHIDVSQRVHSGV